MKRMLCALVFSVSALLLMASSAWAVPYTYTFDDTVTDWPGYPPYHDGDQDVIGDPQVGKTTVTVDITDDIVTLLSVEIEVANRIIEDSLFINTGGQDDSTRSWDSWDYFVRSEYHLINQGSQQQVDFEPNPGLYSVVDSAEDPFAYTTVPNNGRDGQPNGIHKDDLEAVDADENPMVLHGTPGEIGFRADYDEEAQLLTYNFGEYGITLEDGWTIAYAPYCANDITIVGDPVPEPTTMVLLGTGLICFAWGVRRKRSEG